MGKYARNFFCLFLAYRSNRTKSIRTDSPNSNIIDETENTQMELACVLEETVHVFPAFRLNWFESARDSPIDFRADDEYIVADVNRNNIVFRAQGDLFKLHAGGRMWDAAGYPVVTFRKKIMTAHSRWQVFRGNNIDSNHLLFSARKSSMLQVKTKLHVFLAINTAEDVCDFKRNERLLASPAVLANPDWVIRLSFCAPESAHVDLEIFKTTDGDYIVEDVNRNSIVLKVEGKLFKLHDGVRLNDADGNPVVTLRKKVEESCTRDSGSIYDGDASTIVAEMHKKSDKSGKFIVKVHPKMDYAFATTIILILDRMKSSIELKKVSSVVVNSLDN
ncbi:Protein LURP-one-related 15 [Morella rubra]|uniref:Protein LURP-one-related 15 n=1 Tax=Morella rubra TaxID=262757 RepID=A0A6A1WG39_9ROSI|nr:Protein LURP-one-related 15 [Morella rubra]